jgi:hypothetical protein
MEIELSAEAKDKRINRMVALTVVVFSVTTGFGNIKDENLVQAMEEAQANSLDSWNEYQATRLKLHVVETARAQLVAGPQTAGVQKTIADFDKASGKYRDESPKLMKQAQGYKAQYDAINTPDEQFDAADASLSTAISIAAVASLTVSWVPLIAAWVIGGFGLFMTVCGFAGWGFHPDFLTSFFS